MLAFIALLLKFALGAAINEAAFVLRGKRLIESDHLLAAYAFVRARIG